MCLPHIRLQLFTLTPNFFYHITHVHLLQFSPPSIPDIYVPPPRASRGSATHVFLVYCRIGLHFKDGGYGYFLELRNSEKKKFLRRLHGARKIV